MSACFSSACGELTSVSLPPWASDWGIFHVPLLIVATPKKAGLGALATEHWLSFSVMVVFTPDDTGLVDINHLDSPRMGTILVGF